MTELLITTREGTRAGIPSGSIEKYADRLRGELISAGHQAYDQARRVWNGNIDRRPALIARCLGVADVMASVAFARKHDLLIAVRSGAHHAAGYGTCDGGLVIDLSQMKGMKVDPARSTADAQAGLLWGEFDTETQVFGLATTGGVVSDTGIAGLTLGGGLGWLMGKHGLTIDNLLSVDLVTAEGTFLTASADEHTDLFWGLRGGGGNFGVATSFRYRLHPVGPTVLGGMVVHPMARARDVLRFYRDFSTDLPDEAEVHAALATSPDGDPIAALLLGYNGPIEKGEKVLAPGRRADRRPGAADDVCAPQYDPGQTERHSRHPTLLESGFHRGDRRRPDRSPRGSGCRFHITTHGNGLLPRAWRGDPCAQRSDGLRTAPAAVGFQRHLPVDGRAGDGRPDRLDACTLEPSRAADFR